LMGHHFAHAKENKKESELQAGGTKGFGQVMIRLKRPSKDFKIDEGYELLFKEGELLIKAFSKILH
jgi:hypothetical protein